MAGGAGALPFGFGGFGGSVPAPEAINYFWQAEPGDQYIGKWSPEPPVSKGFNEMIWANQVLTDRRIDVGPGVTKFVRVGLWFPVQGEDPENDYNVDVNGSSIVRLVNFGTRIQPIEGMRR